MNTLSVAHRSALIVRVAYAVQFLMRSCGFLIMPRGCAGCDLPDAILCPRCIRDFSDVLTRVLPRTLMGRCFAAGVYRNAVRATILVWKDHGDEELDKQLGDMMSLLATRTVIPWLRQHPERSRRRVYVVPVPSSPTSLRKRGRLHTWCLAKSVARQLRLSGVDAVAMNALRIRRGAVKSVQTSGIRGRLKRAEGLVYSPHPDRLLHRHVVVVDDIVTSGATLRQSVLVLTQAHAYPVTALLLASAVPKQRSTGDLCLHHVCLHHHA